MTEMTFVKVTEITIVKVKTLNRPQKGSTKKLYKYSLCNSSNQTKPLTCPNPNITTKTR